MAESQGLARQLSATFLGKVIEGIWHKGVAVYGNEYYFGGGIQNSPAGTTPYGIPIRVVELGETHVPKDVFEMYLQEISPRYTAETYSLLTHNCNNFSNAVSQFLVGKGIPEYILQLPKEVMSSPMDALLRQELPQVPQFRPQSQPFDAFRENEGPLPHVNSKDGKAEDEPVRSEQPMASLANQVPPAVKPATSEEKMQDRLGDARSKVQEEIRREFAAIMAQGTLRASEAAALATRRVMQKYSKLNAA